MLNFQKKKFKFKTEHVNVLITSDLHFGHKKILEFAPKTRPFASIDEMDEALIKEWNEKVGEYDYIIILGDFSFYGEQKTKEILARLNGKKIFVLGNHDKVLRFHLSAQDLQTFNIVGMYDYLEITVDGHVVCLSHYPMITWNRRHYGSIQFFGHCHGSLPEQPGRQMDVGYDNVGCISKIQDLVELCLKKPVESPDHH